MAWSRSRKVTATAVTISVLAVGGGAVAVSAGSGPDSNRIIGCYQKSSGDLRIVKRPRQCHDDEKVLRWNKRGPRGHIGLPGSDGPGRGATILTGERSSHRCSGRRRRLLRRHGYRGALRPQSQRPLAGGRHLVARQHGTRRAGRADRTRRPCGTNRPRWSGRNGRHERDERHERTTDGEDTILSGTAAPGAGVGNVGDFFLDTTNLLLYGPKTAGGWGTGTSIKGPKGDKGDKGDPGSGNIYSSSTGISPAIVTTLLGGLASDVAVLAAQRQRRDLRSNVWRQPASTSPAAVGACAQVIPDDVTVTSLAATLEPPAARKICCLGTP